MRTLRRGREELIQLVDVAPSEVAEAGSPTAGAEADFDCFYRREYPGLVVLARVLAGPALAEDVAQEAMLVAYRKWNAVRGYESPVGWVRAMCVRKAVAVARRRALERRLPWRVRGQGTPVAAAGRAGLDTSWVGGGWSTNVGDLARRVSEEVRADVHDSLDVEERLGELRVVRRRRRLAKATAGLAAVAAIGGLTVGVLSLGQEAQVPQAGPARAVRVEEACRASDHVRCLDASTILVRDRLPYTFTVTPGLSPAVSEHAGGSRVDVFSDGQENGGVSIMSDVEPAGTATVRGADELARWVAARASLLTTPVTRGNLDGFDTWSLEARLSPEGVAMEARCNSNQSSCRPVLEQTEPYGWQTGVWEGMVSRYTFLDVSGLGTVAVWSWVIPDQDVPWSYADTVLDRYERLVNSIDFQAS